MIEPPAPGTVPDPLLKLDDPFLTVTWIVAPPQLAGKPLSVTLATLLDERLWITPTPPVVQRATLTFAAPRLRGERASEAAAAIEIATTAVQVSRPIRRNISTASGARLGHRPVGFSGPFAPRAGRSAATSR